MVTAMLGVVYWQDAKSSKNAGKIPSNSDTAIKVATSGGTVIGQLGFGFLADVVGRKRMYGLELILIIFRNSRPGSFFRLPPPFPSSESSFFWRVMMGIGIGGDVS